MNSGNSTESGIGDNNYNNKLYTSTNRTNKGNPIEKGKAVSKNSITNNKNNISTKCLKKEEKSVLSGFQNRADISKIKNPEELHFYMVYLTENYKEAHEKYS